MSYTGKNYAEQGGDKWVIGGALEIKEGATVTGLPSADTSMGFAKNTRPVSIAAAIPITILLKR